ncbi:hypothetical protein ACSS6W_009926 [Trichoderma asperelloides]|nr:hypothetical protein LI328DRAFT_149454 [Trichoderma asperelloides]
MTSIKNLLSLLAAVPTPAPISTTVMPTTITAPTIRQCGEVNVFYTGFPGYHPLVLAQGWDPVRVEIGIRNETANLVKAGYNVHAVWAGVEVPISEIEDRMDQSGVNWDVTAVGFGIRGATLEPIVERFEDLIELYARKTPHARIVFNHSPESFIWSVAHRIALAEDCGAAGKPGRLIGYEEICDSRCDRDVSSKDRYKNHDEL